MRGGSQAQPLLSCRGSLSAHVSGALSHPNERSRARTMDSAPFECATNVCATMESGSASPRTVTQGYSEYSHRPTPRGYSRALAHQSPLRSVRPVATGRTGVGRCEYSEYPRRSHATRAPRPAERRAEAALRRVLMGTHGARTRGWGTRVGVGYSTGYWPAQPSEGVPRRVGSSRARARAYVLYACARAHTRGAAEGLLRE